MDALLFIPVAVILVGAYFLLRLRFFIFRPKKMCSDIVALVKKPRALKSLSLALAGTLGVGNIIGVAVGIGIGGAGSVFWLALSAIPAAAIKYSESILASSEGEGCGMMSVMCSTLGSRGERMASIYAFLLVLLAFFMGAGLQCASFAEVGSLLFGIPAGLIGVALIIPVIPILFLGISRIKSVTAVFVSTASVLYIVMSLYVIFLHAGKIPEAFGLILSEAFTPDGIKGGVAGAVSLHALREGFCRGVLSNEAGLGTSSLAHEAESGYTPHEAGIVGVLEVVFDTAVLCPLTALMLLCAGDPSQPTASGYVFSAVKCGGVVFEYIFLASLFCFAFSTVVCWSSYGALSYSYLFGKKRGVFRFLFCLSLPLGAVLGSSSLVTLIDYITLPLAVLSMLTVMKNSDRVIALSEFRKY